MPREQYRAAIEEMYAWFGEVGSGRAPVDREHIRRWWNDAGTMTSDGQVVCAGLDELYRHFSGFPERFTEVEVELPLLAYFEGEDHVAAEYIIRGTGRTGESGAFHVIALFAMEDGKISAMREVAVQTGLKETFKVGDF